MGMNAFLCAWVPAGSPSGGGDVKVCVLDINQLSLPTPFTLFLCLFLSYGPSPVFHSINSPVNSPYSHSVLPVLFLPHWSFQLYISLTPQWGAADAEIKVPSGENTELKRSPFQAWGGSVYSHTCCACCQGVLPCLFLPFQSIHLHFFQNLPQFFPVLACRIK